MIMGYTVNYDTYHGYDRDESFQTLREAMRFYDSLDHVPYKDLTCDDTRHGTLTLLNSKGENNLVRFGFHPCDYRR